MTREEAIAVLEKEASIIDDNSIEMTAREWDEFDDLKRDAIPVAIEALKARPTEGDIISKADAIEAIASRDETDGTVKVFTGRQVNEILTALPSAQPEPNTGRWIPQNDKTKRLYGWWFCSECSAWIGEPTPYCSNCGAKMEVPDAD